MSSVFRKAPLQTLETKAWAICQPARGNPQARVWAWWPGLTEFAFAEGGAAADLCAKVLALGGIKREIPESWKAMPTGADIQVHLRFPGQPQKETLQGGLESALYGGFDSLVTMPNTNPFLDSPEALAAAIAAARSTLDQYPVRVGFTASATMGMQGQTPTDIVALAKAGAVAITDDGWGVKSAEAQAAIFRACAETDLLFQQHAEMPGHKGVATASAFQRQHQLQEYPRTAESGMVQRDLELLRSAPGARYHILHISTRETLEEIRRAKTEGLRVTAEVTPHHLFFSNAEIPAETDNRSAYFKMNPPLFAPEDRAALVEALADGTIDCVSTDHAPHERELKAKGWAIAPFGTRGMETALSTLLTLVQRGDLSWNRMVEVFSTAPRKVLGHREFARPSGLLFVDPTAEITITENELPGISVNSCFLGTSLHGKIMLRCEQGKLFSFTH